jgi:hypothetical protein
MFVCCGCCVLAGRVLCNEVITCSEESGLWCVVVCDVGTSSRMRRPWPALGHSAMGVGELQIQNNVLILAVIIVQSKNKVKCFQMTDSS